MKQYNICLETVSSLLKEYNFLLLHVSMAEQLSGVVQKFAYGVFDSVLPRVYH